MKVTCRKTEHLCVNGMESREEGGGLQVLGVSSPE